MKYNLTFLPLRPDVSDLQTLIVKSKINWISDRIDYSLFTNDDGDPEYMILASFGEGVRGRQIIGYFKEKNIQRPDMRTVFRYLCQYPLFQKERASLCLPNNISDDVVPTCLGIHGYKHNDYRFIDTLSLMKEGFFGHYYTLGVCKV